jgi:hypothetical protein
LKAQGFNDRVLALTNENKAHSDDELAKGGPDSVYHIKEKEGQATGVATFFRMADKQCQQMNKSKSGCFR